MVRSVGATVPRRRPDPGPTGDRLPRGVQSTSDSSGAYSITLDAGEWKVSVKGGIARIVSGPETVTVPAGGSVSADYIIDSGIRLPAASPVD